MVVQVTIDAAALAMLVGGILCLLVAIGLAVYTWRVRRQPVQVRAASPQRVLHGRKCQIVTFRYSNGTEKVFHEHEGFRHADLDEAFGKAQAPSGAKLLEVRGGSHLVEPATEAPAR